MKGFLTFWIIVLFCNFCTISVFADTLSTNSSEKSGFVQVPGGKIWYKIFGVEKKGIPLLCLHGGPGATHDYLLPLAEIADERPVIFYDQLGSGNSDKPTDQSLWTISRFVEELEIVRKELGLKKVHILGQSWGSMLATDYILTKNPTGIMSLIFSGPCLSVKKWVSDQRAYLNELPENIKKVIFEKEAAKDFSSTGYQNAMNEYYKLHICRMAKWPECVNNTFAKMGHQVYEYMCGPSEFDCSGTLKDYERVESLKKLKLPVFYTCGEFDEATPKTVAFYQENTPGSEFKVYKAASHMHHIEQEKEYLSDLRNFLRKIENQQNIR
ncbi:MAG: proline iminopeptidase-family hydrolase [Candidatus Riflebacteria bacterium]|nr:proline iminopeptidase-family hydrolase [Candidatus Riflebacteria bacterium]